MNDWKSEAEKIIRPPGTWHFKFNETKRFILTKPSGKLLVRGEVAIGAGKSVTRKGRIFMQMNKTIAEPGIQLPETKINDVKKLLLKHFGENWSNNEELKYYNNVLESNVSAMLNVSEDPICEIVEQHEGLRI